MPFSRGKTRFFCIENKTKNPKNQKKQTNKEGLGPSEVARQQKNKTKKQNKKTKQKNKKAKKKKKIRRV